MILTQECEDNNQALRRLKFPGGLYTHINAEIMKDKCLVKVSLLFLSTYHYLIEKQNTNIESHKIRSEPEWFAH